MVIVTFVSHQKTIEALGEGLVTHEPLQGLRLIKYVGINPVTYFNLKKP